MSGGVYCGIKHPFPWLCWHAACEAEWQGCVHTTGGNVCGLGLRYDQIGVCPDVNNIYELPATLHDEDLDDRILEKLGIWAAAPQLEAWEDMVERAKNPAREIQIGIVGKYVHLGDTYKSLNEALAHGGFHNECKVNLKFLDSETIESENIDEMLGELDAILVPGGFGERGIEGKILAVNYARTNDVPFFGICLGMQVAVIEYARNMLSLADANSREFSETTEFLLFFI